MAGTFGSAYYAPLYFHLLPFIEQDNVFKGAAWLDYTGRVGGPDPNRSTTINVGVIWPTWDSVNISNYTWLRQTQIKVYQCPSDPSLNNGLDWQPGDSSYAGNFQVFGRPTALPATGNNWAVLEPAFDGAARLAGTFQDGTSNTILFAEKYARCDGTGSPGGTWWMRGVWHGSQIFGTTGSDDSYPADRLSAVFGGGRGRDGVAWISGPASLFQVQPPNPTKVASAGGRCDRRLASSPHTNGMNVGLADGSVRFVSQGISANTWWFALTPAGGEVMGSDW
jgi:prepilin-type processing-associated H-X9-DG protein